MSSRTLIFAYPIVRLYRRAALAKWSTLCFRAREPQYAQPVADEFECGPVAGACAFAELAHSHRLGRLPERRCRHCGAQHVI